MRKRREHGHHDPQVAGPTGLDRVVEVVLTSGLVASGLLLLAGLALADNRLL